MTREEILLAALANANGQNPVELAKQMQEFLDGEPKPQPKQSTIADYEAAMILHAREAENKKPKRNRAIWGQEELHQLDQMLTVGSSFKEIAINLDRSEKAIQSVVRKIAAGYPIGRRKKAPE